MPRAIAEAPLPTAQIAAPGGVRPLAERNVLLLQGLMGPLFRRVGQELRRNGYGVHKVNFNGGDRAFWRLPNAIDYRGSLDDWPDALHAILTGRRITDVILFGDCRPHHLVATEVCRALRISVHVFEEGYIRPGWVTLEPGGVNGHSSLPRDPEWYRTEAAALGPAPEHHLAPSSFRRRALEAIVYNCADVFSRWHYPHWENHRPWHPLIEGIGWVRRLRRRKEAARRSEALVSRLTGESTDFMLFPLQLDSDAQIRLHSSFAGVADALRMVIRSFAEHAPTSLRLVVKEHPLDNGVRNWRQETALLAALYGVEDRVDYMETGDMVPIARLAKGMVTINSTSGTLALAFDVPVIVLGQAVYDIEDVTYQGRLDDFWTRPGRPDGATFQAFCRVLIDRCLVAGGFFSEEALDMVTKGVIARLETASPIRRVASRARNAAAPSSRLVARESNP